MSNTLLMMSDIDSLAMQICLSVFIFVLGTVIGSFLNVVILRTPLKESISRGRSHCMSCRHTLAWYDLFPVFSYIFLGGKCRYCKAKISSRYMIVELITGICYLTSLWTLGLSVWLIFAVIVFPIIIVASFMDIDTMQIPYGCTISLAVIGAVATVISFFDADTAPWYEHLIGAVVIAVPFAVLALFGGMGGGDVQLMAAAGLLLGWKIVPAAVVGIVLGAILGTLELARVPKGKNAELTTKISSAAKEWYTAQRENGGGLVDGKSDVLFGTIFKGKTDIDDDCADRKSWEKTPDIKALNSQLSAATDGNSKFAFSITLENGDVKTVKCKKSIVFGPYLSLGIAWGLLVGQQIIDWYLGMLHL